MSKSLMMVILISSMLIVQGCMPEVRNDSKVEAKIMNSLDEQLFKAAESRDTKSIEKVIQEGAISTLKIRAEEQLL